MPYSVPTYFNTPGHVLEYSDTSDGVVACHTAIPKTILDDIVRLAGMHIGSMPQTAIFWVKCMHNRCLLKYLRLLRPTQVNLFSLALVPGICFPRHHLEMAGQPSVPRISLGTILLSSTGKTVNAMDEKPRAKPRWARSPATWPLRIFYSIPSLIFLLLPSFLINYYRPSAAMKPSSLHPTSYLDGLRGIAAFITYTYHFGLMWRWHDLETGYGSAHSDRYWYQFPIVRLLVSGRASVTVFFVISGYVLSIRTLDLIYHGGSQKWDKVLSSLSSSVFRRPIRLYLPIAAITAILSVLVQIHFPFLKDHLSGSGVAFTADDKQGQLINWWSTMSSLFNPFHIEGVRGQNRHVISTYISPLWTIPIEFKGSIAVFLMLLAFARARRALALAVTFLMGIVWQLHAGDADMALFMAGMFLAELYIIAPPASVSDFLARKRTSLRSHQFLHVAHHVVVTLLLLFSLWLLSMPMIDSTTTPGYGFLHGLAPAWYDQIALEIPITNMVHLFWLAVGSMLLVFALMYAPPARMVVAASSIPKAIDEESQQQEAQELLDSDPLDSSTQFVATNASMASTVECSDDTQIKEHRQPRNQKQPSTPFLQRLFTNRISQYLGALSYSLYIVHEPVNHVVGSRWAVPGYDLWEAYDETFSSGQVVTPNYEASKAAALSAFRQQFWRWYAISFLLNTVTLIWVSDLFMRAVDGPAVRFARWLGRLVEAKGHPK